ncbi:chondroitinase family polysaccharide lyase [Paenibacillus qinlingensis]|uniref:Chondroitin-sulfate-ABC endolyase/exolyase n=1 Tax=Paenibacillus qinlingensis TaxID=1837343 RepID=A0ABU1NTF1_9BACL|nr:chondroitinase family polysaccharide lyase [Paenibacillus qinlingensis]MDR6550765.1 chondroitin-sulfate-ABC endolyase/exolyase [Paenibacillus qinlingensis]
MKIFSFDHDIPQHLGWDEDSDLSISDRHYKYGSHSLQWKYHSHSYLRLTERVEYRPFQEGATSQERDSFVVWIYNNEPLADVLTFQLGRQEEVDCEFEFHLNFRGWRTAWVAYERDMRGVPHPEMDTLTIRAPKTVSTGTLYINQLMLNTPIDPRFHTRDKQVPFVNLEADQKANAHWLSLLAFEELERRHRIPDVISSEQQWAHGVMSQRLEELIFQARIVAEEDFLQMKGTFSSYGISRRGDVITGRPIELPFFDHYPQADKERLKALANSIQLAAYTDFMLDIATSYRSIEDPSWKDDLQVMFIDLLDHLHDQGWAYGSSQGTVHHFGYNFRSFYQAVFLMRDELELAERLQRTQNTMYWYSGAGRIHTPLNEIEGNIDIFNTTLQGILASLLIMPDAPLKVRELTAFREWLSQSLLPAHGLRSAYKLDGSAYHHVNHYPAYAIGGFLGVTPVVYLISGTVYRIDGLAHKSVRKALLAMRLYCNKYEWLVSLSSRHPTGKGALEVEPFKYMALSGTPDGLQLVDQEVAAAYLRLRHHEEKSEVAEQFLAKGITPEEDPNGHWTMNFAALAIHRRGSWLVGARGHSRYLWANESYVSANLYGRYISHGHVQIMSQGEPITNEASGYHHDGWDWNRWPGTTTVHKPIPELRSDVRNVDTFSGFEEMLLSDETYAGGLNLEGRSGMFAMKLHEHPKYEGSHRARKSVFFFDNRVICLGSDIENSNTVYATETTLFQNHLADQGNPIWVNDQTQIDEFPYAYEQVLEEPVWLLDHLENGYYIPAGQTLSISKDTQHSKHQAADADTQGDFATAWLGHGDAPKQGSYEYTILVKTDRDSIEAFSQHMQSLEAAPYCVLQKDRNAHIVKDHANQTTAYALFEAHSSVDTGWIVETDTPAMIMIREANDELIISAVDPDLRLYEGIESDQYDAEGNRVEVSVYSRDWIHAESIPSTIQLTLRGHWLLKGDCESARIAANGDDYTVVAIECENAMPREFVLQKGQP